MYYVCSVHVYDVYESCLICQVVPSSMQSKSVNNVWDIGIAPSWGLPPQTLYGVSSLDPTGDFRPQDFLGYSPN